MEDPNSETGQPILTVHDFNLEESFPDAHQDFNIAWNYVNLMNGPLLPPEDYQLYAQSMMLPQLEVGPFFGSEVPAERREVPWGEVPQGEYERMSETFNLSEGNYQRELLNLPASVDPRLIAGGFEVGFGE